MKVMVMVKASPSSEAGEMPSKELREQEAGARAIALGLGGVRFEGMEPRVIAGLNERFSLDTLGNIPQLWQRFMPYLGHIPGQKGKTAYGVCWNPGAGCSFDYLVGVEVGDTAHLPAGFEHLQLARGRYAVLTHSQHVGSIKQTIDTIWTRWVPDCGLRIAAQPWFERYSETFDPATGLGGIEIWLPLAE
jgi:AraC family transcriptional regulator